MITEFQKTWRETDKERNPSIATGRPIPPDVFSLPTVCVKLLWKFFGFVFYVIMGPIVGKMSSSSSDTASGQKDVLLIVLYQCWGFAVTVVMETFFGWGGVEATSGNGVEEEVGESEEKKDDGVGSKDSDKGKKKSKGGKKKVS